MTKKIEVYCGEGDQRKEGYYFHDTSSVECKCDTCLSKDVERRVFSKTGFEKHAGKEKCKNANSSIHVDGGKQLGKWLKENNLTTTNKENGEPSEKKKNKESKADKKADKNTKNKKKEKDAPPETQQEQEQPSPPSVPTSPSKDKAGPSKDNKKRKKPSTAPTSPPPAKHNTKKSTPTKQQPQNNNNKKKKPTKTTTPNTNFHTAATTTTKTATTANRLIRFSPLSTPSPGKRGFEERNAADITIWWDSSSPTQDILSIWERMDDLAESYNLTVQDVNAEKKEKESGYEITVRVLDGDVSGDMKEFVKRARVFVKSVLLENWLEKSESSVF